MLMKRRTRNRQLKIVASHPCPICPMAMPNGQLMTNTDMAVASSLPVNHSTTIFVK